MFLMDFNNNQDNGLPSFMISKIYKLHLNQIEPNLTNDGILVVKESFYFL